MRDTVLASRSLTGPGVAVPVGGSLAVTIVVGPNNGRLFGNYVPVGIAAPTGAVSACLQGPNSEVCLNPSYSQTATHSSAEIIQDRLRCESIGANANHVSHGDVDGSPTVGAAVAVHTEPSQRVAPLQLSGLLFACAFAGAYAKGKRQRLVAMASFGLFAAVLATAGGGGGQSIQPPPPLPAVGTTYSVVVSATANGIVHLAKIIEIVQ